MMKQIVLKRGFYYKGDLSVSSEETSEEFSDRVDKHVEDIDF